MTNRSCEPLPMMPTPSDASMLKEIFRPSTAVTVAVAVIVAPIGEGASWLMDREMPTVPHHHSILVVPLLVQLLP